MIDRPVLRGAFGLTPRRSDSRSHRRRVQCEMNFPSRLANTVSTKLEPSWAGFPYSLPSRRSNASERSNDRQPPSGRA